MQKNEQRRPFSLKKNLAVIAAILLLVLGLILLSQTVRPPTAPEALPTDAPTRSGDGGAEAFVLIYVRGRLRSIEPLDEDRDVEIAQPTGETNVVHITRNGFHMASSTCDNQLCVGQGEVTTENYTRRILGTAVLCLPNQVELELMIPSATASPDALDR